MRFGIIGTGRIAKRFVPECQSVPDAEISAVYNPHAGSADEFIKKIWQDPDLKYPASFSDLSSFWDTADTVYIASPHENHYEYIMQALEHGKHVLCEKPMVLKKDQAVEAYRKAEEAGLILLEGLKTAYCPGYLKVKELVESGVIGDIGYVDACFTKLEDKTKRELTDTDFGGSFTELGSYVMLPALDILGVDYIELGMDSIFNENGIDIFTKADIRYPDGLATLTCGLGVKSEGRLVIGGSKGYIKVDAPWWKTEHIEVHFEDPSETVSYDESFEGDGLRYEIRHLMDGNAGNKDVSIAMASVMESFLEKRNGNRPGKG